MNTRLRAAGRSDVGRTRERNEDAIFVGSHVFAVADGLGGHRGGDVASELALEPIRALDDIEPRRAANHVADAVRKANRTVFERAQSDANLKGMGTTMTAVAIYDGIAHVAHVGDSRCYLMRGNEITQLSGDHTLVARMVADGKLTPEQAEAHPQRSVLTRALGNERDVSVQTQNIVLLAGDRLLLCSDGLTGVLSEEEILLLGGHGSDLDEICGALVTEANARGGPDNITVAVIEVEASPREDIESRPAPAPRDAGRRAPVRALIWAGLALVVLLAGTLGVRSWADRSYYVGVQDDKVTIYRGLPVDFLGISLSKVEEPTDVEVSDIDHPALVRSLEDGIRAPTLQEARRIVVEQIEPHVRGRDGGIGDLSDDDPPQDEP